MAVQTVKIYRAIELERDAAGRRAEITVEVRVDSPDTPLDVVEAACPFALGSTFQYGSFSDPNSVCRSISPVRASQYVWLLVCQFVAVEVTDPTATVQTRRIDEGFYPLGGDDAPLAKDADDGEYNYVSVDARGRDEPVYRALFKGFFDARGDEIQISNPHMIIGEIMNITNSALTPLNPPLTTLKFDTAFTVVVYTSLKWAESLDVAGKLNSTRVRFLTHQFDAQFEPLTLWCTGQRWAPTSWGNVISFEFLYRRRQWYPEELDRGLARRALLGDPGMPQSKSDPDWAKFKDKPHWQRLTDQSGLPLSDPIPLDGNGQPLNSDNPADAIFLRWLPVNLEQADLPNLFPNSPFLPGAGITI